MLLAPENGQRGERVRAQRELQLSRRIAETKEET